MALFATATVLQYRENTRLHAELEPFQRAVLEAPVLPEISPPAPGTRAPSTPSRIPSKPASGKAKPDPTQPPSKGVPFAEIALRIETQIQNGSSRQAYENWQKLIADVRPEDFPRVMVLIEKSSQRSVRDSARYTLLRRWAESDPGAAITYAAGLKGKAVHDNAIYAVLTTWSDKDPAAAEAWVRTLPPGQLREQAMNSVINGLAEKNPQAAYDLYKESIKSQRDRGALYQIFASWAKMDPATAILQAEGLSGQQRGQALQSIASTWGGKDPQRNDLLHYLAMG
jgi:hypothetical protein